MSSCYYCIYLIGYRHALLVNIRDGDFPDVIVVVKPDYTIAIHDYSQEIARELFGDVSAHYSYRHMIFTADDEGNVATASFLYYCESGRVKDYVATKGFDRMAMRMARFVMWCECIRNDRSRAVQVALGTSKYNSGKDKDEDKERCVICHEEYCAEDIIGTLDCRHKYHEKCIKDWMISFSRSDCPICRRDAFFFAGI